MVYLTKDQRKALKRVFDRCELIMLKDDESPSNREALLDQYAGPNLAHKWLTETKPMTYRQFRKLVRGGWGCIMVPWCGMWLGIEKDGYTHS